MPKELEKNKKHFKKGQNRNLKFYIKKNLKFGQYETWRGDQT